MAQGEEWFAHSLSAHDWPVLLGRPNSHAHFVCSPPGCITQPGEGEDHAKPPCPV